VKKLSDQLLEELSQETQQHLDKVFQLKKLSSEKLNFKPSPKKWSALECVEHLRLYADLYLNEFEENIKKSTSSCDDYFKSGLIGGYFAKSMLPGEKSFKMKTFASMNPGNSELSLENVLNAFIKQEEKLLSMMEDAKAVSLKTVKIPLSVMPLIKFSLGDMLKVMVFHNRRHLEQAQRSIDAFF
jgi:hypothetical protein